MRLEVLTPERRTLDAQVRRIRAEAPGGHFGLLPGHGDFVTRIVPGILVYQPDDGPHAGQDRFVAVNSGTLVKCGSVVLVAVREALEGDDLDHLGRRVAETFRRHNEEEREARAALARLEASMIRRLRELEIVGR